VKAILITGLILVLIPVFALLLWWGMERRQAELRRRWSKTEPDIDRQCYGRTTEDWLFAEQIEADERVLKSILNYGDFAANHVEHVRFSKN
jgi:hypothetical protein